MEINNDLTQRRNIPGNVNKDYNSFESGLIGVCGKDKVSTVIDILLDNSITLRTVNMTIETYANSSEPIQYSNKHLNSQNEQEDTKSDNRNEGNSKMNMAEIDELLNRKKIEYAHKIQEIELQLLKLENRLLTETLGKQNTSASYIRLENLILKLENELLKINKSFVIMQQENVQLRNKQLSEEQIFDLFNKAKKENSEAEQKFMALAGNSTALESMVDKQQNKIIELVLMMHNQTDFINKLEEKSQRLEEQNRQLHEVLVNQSNMMSELVKGMKYMKEEQEKLKSTVTQPLPLTTNYSPIKEEVSADTKPPHVRDERNHQHDQNEGNNVLKDNEVPRKNDALFEGKLNIIQAPETNSELMDNSEETAFQIYFSGKRTAKRSFRDKIRKCEKYRNRIQIDFFRKGTRERSSSEKTFFSS